MIIMIIWLVSTTNRIKQKIINSYNKTFSFVFAFQSYYTYVYLYIIVLIKISFIKMLHVFSHTIKYNNSCVFCKRFVVCNHWLCDKKNTLVYCVCRLYIIKTMQTASILCPRRKICIPRHLYYNIFFFFDF